MTIDWASVVLTEAFLKRLNRLSKRTFTDETTAEEAVTFILETLSAGQWQKLASFTGKSAPETFAFSVCSRLLVDHFRTCYGRTRAPVWLKKNGPLWEMLWKELCLDKKSPREIVERHTHCGYREADMILDMIRTIKAKIPWCGVSSRPVSLDDEHNEWVLNHTTTCTLNDEASVTDTASATLFAQLLLAGGEETQVAALPESADPELVKKIVMAVESLQLSEMEYQIFRWHFNEGLSGAAIADRLGIPTHQPVRLIRRGLERARTKLVDLGVEVMPS